MVFRKGELFEVKRKERIKFLQGEIKGQRLSGALLFYSRDIFYYTGTAQPSYLAVLPESFFLFVRSGYEFAVNEVFIDKSRVKEERRLENVYQETFSKLPSKKIATELDILPTKRFLTFRKIFDGWDFVDVSPLVLEQRKRKDSSEINQIKRACEVIDLGHKAVLETMQEGVTELELAAAVENAHRLAGHEGIFFIRQPDFFMSRGPLSSGSNLFRISGVVYTITGVGLSPSVPAGPSQRKISKGEPVIVDIPTLVNGYHADQTRTYVLDKATEQVRSMYENLREIADYLIENMKAGMTCSHIFQMASAKSEKLRVADVFLNFGRGKRSHMIGHGVGLELNEPPILSEYNRSEISDGHVIALDMHMMDENAGVVKLEDMILIKRDGNEVLTKSPRELFEVN